MQNVKRWYESKTVWGGAVAVLAMIAGIAGFDFDDDARTQLVDAILQIVGAGGALLAIFGRVVATDLIE